MTLKSCINSRMCDEGKIINLNKLAHEKNLESQVKVLEKAKELSDSTKINLRLNTYTKINLSAYYCKEGQSYKALTILNQQFEVIKSFNEFIWEKSILLFMIGSIKSQIGLIEESINNALESINYLKFTKLKDINFFTVLVSAYYNLASGYQNIYKMSLSLKYFDRAKQIAMIKLGPANSLTIFLNKKQISSIDKYIETIENLSLNNIMQHNIFHKDHKRSKTSVKSDDSKKDSDKKFKFYKKFIKSEKVNNSLSFCEEKSENKLFLSYRAPLSSLIEEEEEYYPNKFNGKVKKSTKTNSNNESFQKISPVFDLISSPSLNEYTVSQILSPVSMPLSFKSIPKLAKISQKGPKKTKKSEKEKQLKAALIIQKNIRKFIALKNYQKTREKIISIQKYVKMYQVKKIYKQIKSAVIFIQRFIRQKKFNQRILSSL